MLKTEVCSHVSFIIVTNLLDADVILCINKRLRCGVRLGQCHNTGNILKIILIVHFHLESKYKYADTYGFQKYGICAEISKYLSVPVLPFPFPSEHGPSLPLQEIEGRWSVTRALINFNQSKVTHTVAFFLLYLQEILIHIDALKASPVLSACDCRGGDDCSATTVSL